MIYSSMDTPISILSVILNWNQPLVTIDCCKYVRECTYPHQDILLIDNGSQDNSISLFQTKLPDIELIELPNNKGFAGGVNIGLQRAIARKYDFALLLNNDAFPAPNMLQNLLAEYSADIGLYAPKIFFDHDRSRIWFAGGVQAANLLEVRDSGMGELDSEKWSYSRDVQYLLGTCLLVSLQAVKQVGFLDEQFFMYYEDLDWSIRMRQAGYRLRFVHNAHLFHRVSFSSGGMNSPIQRYHLAKSSILFFAKHIQKGKPWRIILFRFGSALLKTTQFILTNRWNTAKFHIKGLIDGIKIVFSKRAAKSTDVEGC